MVYNEAIYDWPIDQIYLRIWVPLDFCLYILMHPGNTQFTNVIIVWNYIRYIYSGIRSINYLLIKNKFIHSYQRATSLQVYKIF